tara:strand:- start:973 stop:2547 length:1575 start_codon:yes stop_codon:yes gene_type:complete
VNNRKAIHGLLLLLVVGVLWNCAGSPPELIPEPITEKIVQPKPVVVIPPSPPNSISINSITYDRHSMTIKWDSSLDSDFNKYILLISSDDASFVDTLSIKHNVGDTIYILDSFDPTIANWFWILVENKAGLSTEGERYTHILETEPPDKTRLSDTEFDGLLKIRWRKNKNDDFSSYELYRSITADMGNKINLKTLDSIEDTLFVLPMDDVYYYQVGVKDHWGLESYSNIIKGDYLVELWGQSYSMLSTKEIDLSSMKLFGEIPNGIGLFLNLEILRLQNNFLSGSFPEDFWKLKKLRLLNLSNNQFSGNIPNLIDRLISLEELWLSNNQFSGELPYQLFSLNHLTHLNISDNYIQGHLSESLSRLSNLEYLNLWNNQLIGFIPIEIGSLSKLEFLSLSGNGLKGAIPSELGNAKLLRSIALFENELTGTIPMSITRLPKLEYLGLFDNNLIGSIPNHLMNSLDLSYLRLNKNKFESIDHGSMCASGYDWYNFTYFDVSNNDFDKPPICFHSSEMLMIQSSYLKK